MRSATGDGTRLALRLVRWRDFGVIAARWRRSPVEIGWDFIF
jgi:hypothetical protein